METPTIIIGTGNLFKKVIEELQQQDIYNDIFTVSHTLPSESLQTRVISLEDSWDAHRDLALQRELLGRRCPWLPVRADFSKLWVGPWIFPNEPGCIACFEERRECIASSGASRAGTAFKAAPALDVLSRHPCIPSGSVRWLISWLRELLAYPIAERVPSVKHWLFLWNLFNLRIEKHVLLPVSGCTVCNPLPEDQDHLAMITIQPRSKMHPDVLRIRDLGELFPSLLQEVVSPQVGIIYDISAGADASLAVAGASLPIPGSSRLELGVGRATNVEQAKRIAVLEALERYAGLQPRRTQSVLRATYRELADQAIDPRTLLLYSAEQYAIPGFRFQPFSEDQEYLWVWAFSFRHQRPLAVPEEFIYYGPLQARGRTTHEPMLTCELSNGCALGNCPEEAILHGLFEVLERDAFLLTWYARNEPRCLDIESARDRRIPLLVDTLLQQGYETFAFDITQEFGIPTIWVMISSKEDDPSRFKTLSAAGCHLDPEQALWGGLLEVATSVSFIQDRYQSERARGLTLLEASNAVEGMHDHALLYALPEAFPRLQFLFRRSQHPVTFDKAFPNMHRHYSSFNLTEDLMMVLQIVLREGLDILVVDQTPQEQSRFGLVTMRMLVPGLLPMTFGQQYRRYHNCTRLLRLLDPHLENPSSEIAKKINSWPHPFP